MGRDFRLLDHLAPLSYLMQMPLLVTEEENVKLLQKYYPMTEVLYEDYEDLSYSELAENYDAFFQSTFWEENLIRYFADLKKIQKKFIYCPHGNSDKGHKEPMMRKIIEQDMTLLYGKHMIQLLKKQNLWEKIPTYALTGNYRYTFYKKFKSFYDSLLFQKLSSNLDQNLTTILYAPTWHDREKSTSFYSVTEKLAEQLPEDMNLIIKTHPLLEEREPALYWKNLPKERKNLIVLTDFPPIYPLLNFVDIYLGDFSSIGYDFLKFEKPMFFFDLEKRGACPSRYLHQTGTTIPRESFSDYYGFIRNNLNRKLSFKDKQRQIYEFAFGEEKPLESVKKNILEKIQAAENLEAINFGNYKD